MSVWNEAHAARLDEDLTPENEGVVTQTDLVSSEWAASVRSSDRPAAAPLVLRRNGIVVRF